VLLVDNYDSFTYNLVQYLGQLGARVVVERNDRLTRATVARLQPDKIVISPGPGTPRQAGICLELIAWCAGSIPLLGVCLGHQAIAQAFGGVIGQAPRIMHGKVSQIHHDGRTLFAGVENPCTAMRYHSLIVERGALPACLEVSAWTQEGEIMGLRHCALPVEGLQFHPESILTPTGKAMLENFLRR